MKKKLFMSFMIKPLYSANETRENVSFFEAVSVTLTDPYFPFYQLSES